MHISRSILRRWRFVALGIACTAEALTAGSAKAGTITVNVSGVQLPQAVVIAGQPLTVNYVLGGSGVSIGAIAGVRIDILDGATVKKTTTLTPPATGTQFGANTVQIDTAGIPSGSTYTVRVTATTNSVTSPTTTDYFLISNPNDPALRFVNPRGVDVNRNTGSASFGRVYVTEGLAGTVGSKSTVKGLYILNPDLSEAFPGSEPKLQSGGPAPWASSGNSPQRVVVGPDDTIYVCDWSDLHSGVYTTNANGDNPQDLFAYTPPGSSRGTTGLVLDSLGTELYSSISGVWVEGTGANRKVYTCDYYLNPGGSVWRYDIPAGTNQWAQPPTAAAIANNGLYNSDFYGDVVRDSAGNFYLSNYYTDEAFKFDKDGNKIATLGSTGSWFNGIAIDNARDKIALASGDGKIYLTDKSFATATAIVSGLGADVRDVAFDADGWIYAVDYQDQRLSVYAPPGTYPVSGGSATGSQALVITSIPLPGDIAPVDASGINIGPNGHKFGDGKVDLKDIVYSMRVYAGLNQMP